MIHSFFIYLFRNMQLHVKNKISFKESKLFASKYDLRSPGSLVEAAIVPRNLDGRAALEKRAQEWRGRTLVLRRTGAPAGQNGGAGPWYCE